MRATVMYLAGDVCIENVPDPSITAASERAFFKNIRVSGGPAPVRAYIEELLPDILDGRIEPGRVFDRVIGVDEVPDGYRAMNDAKRSRSW
jgi:threonine dehydrogenase-like Zn-dependent dehydrogenase